jgi:MoaA/NifB/PqqE/SkfB family radical SAM enzyme/glycosyltransferase involved in cell wall biosynthesis
VTEHERTLKTITVVRTGFSIPSPASAGLDGPIVKVPLGESFSTVWNAVRVSGAKYAIFIDDAISCRTNEVALLLRILDGSSAVDGITLDASGLATVYGIAPPTQRAIDVPWAVSRIESLPSWFAALRVDAWREASGTHTLEFFLLLHGAGKNLLRTTMPHLKFDAMAWAADLIDVMAPLLAMDYASVASSCSSFVPLQFQVTIPGECAAAATPSRAFSGPLFSVICPCFRPEFLRDAVESVLNQTWQDWELRIRIDGPAGNQLRQITAILADFKWDPRVHIRHQDNLGTGPTRRRLSEDARGEFIVVLDDDDRLQAHALERFAREIETNPGVAALRGGAWLFGLLEAYLAPRRRFTVGGISNDLFEVTQPYVVRRDVLHLLGGYEWDPGLKNSGEDSDLFLKLDRARLPLAVIDEPLYDRRLSTLNQTLACTSEECLQHVQYLYGKYHKRGWRLERIDFRDHGTVVGMRTVHRDSEGPAEVVCSTRFMNFQQVGARDGIVLDLELTSLCNATCEFCPREHLQREAKFLSRDALEGVAQSLREERGRPLVVLAGIGESTLHPDLFEFIEILEQAGARVCLTTNGWNLSLELVDRLVEAGLSELNVSLNAVKPDTHATLMQMRGFGEITAACQRVAAVRARRWPAMELHVSFVVTDKNADEAEAFVELWRSRGASQVWLHRLTNRSGLLARDCRPGDMEALARKYAGDPRVVVDMFPDRDGPRNLCRVAHGVDFISADGEMLLCAQDYSRRHRFGDIRHAGLTRLREVKLLSHLRSETVSICSCCTFCPPSLRKDLVDIAAPVQLDNSPAVQNT